MKKFLLTLAITAIALTASAASIRYFTAPQATRAVHYLNQQSEIMLYYGYPDEIETYVLVSDVWSERVNSQFFEIWLYGFDAYTGDEICMPLDLNGVWLFSGNRIYSAAQYLRFRNEMHRPTFQWFIPPYNPYNRVPHPVHYAYTYHWYVHQPGWHYTHPMPAGMPPLPPYYYRVPAQPRPIPHHPWTPGVDRPTVVYSNTFTDRGQGNTNTRGGNNGSSNSRGSNSVGGTTSRPANNTATNTRGNGTTTNTRGTSTTSEGRGSNTEATGNTRGTSTTTNTRGTSTTTNTRGTSTTTEGRGTTSTQSNTRGTTTTTEGRGTATTQSNTRSTSAATTTTTRGTSATTQSNSRGTSATTQSNSRGTSTSGNTRGTSTSSSNGRGTSTSGNTRGTR